MEEKKETNSNKVENINPWMIATVVVVILFAGYILMNQAPAAQCVGPECFDTNSTVNLDKNITDTNKVNVEVEDKGEPVVTIYEASDYECPACASLAATIGLDSVAEKLTEELGVYVKYEFYNFPLSYHPNADKAAEAAECARDQGKFKEMHDKLFEVNRKSYQAEDVSGALTTNYSNDKLVEYVQGLGLDMEKFKECFFSAKKKSMIDEQVAYSRNNGLEGTPTIFINNQKYTGQRTYDAIKTFVDGLLVAKDDPAVELKVVVDKDNQYCNNAGSVAAEFSSISSNFKVVGIDVSDDEGKTLVEIYDVEKLPLMIFGDNVDKIAKFSEISESLEKVEDGYMLVNETFFCGVIAEKDVAFEITLLQDVNCETCEQAKTYIESLQPAFFPKATISVVNYSTEEGKALAEKYDAMMYPIYFFSGDIENSVAFDMIEPLLTKKGDIYFWAISDLAAEFIGEIGTSNDAYYGDENATLEIIEFSEFACPFCAVAAGLDRQTGKIVAENSVKSLVDDYNGQVKLVYKHLIVHPDSATESAIASECGRQQGNDNFWKFHDYFFETNKLTKADGIAYAEELGLDMNLFNACIEADETMDKITKDSITANEAGFGGTPSFLVAGQVVVGAQGLSVFKAIIDEKLAE